MTTTTMNNGRMGNQIIRNLAVSFIAEKNDLFVNYANKESIEKLGIDLFVGEKTFNKTSMLTDNNYFDIYNSKLEENLNPNNHYFQTNQIMSLIYNHLHSEKVKSNIISKNPFNERYNTNNDCLVHIRLTDTAHWNPGINYYLNTIKNIKFDNLYITTDDKNHEFIHIIKKYYPSAKIIDYDEITTFQFASTFKNIVLSHGSFSAMIGYLAFFSNIFYPEYEYKKIWYGDMFSVNTWNKCSLI